MKTGYVVGNKTFKYKKDIILHYRNILNSYKTGETLCDDDFYDVIFLLKRFDFFEENATSLDDELYLKFINETIFDIKIYQVQYNNKCFGIEYHIEDDPEHVDVQYISFSKIINQHKYNPFYSFRVACRNAVKDDIFAVKQKYFDDSSVKGKAKCQETGILSKWEELVVDHRQPFTLSMIVDRFIELKNIDINNVEYLVDDNNIFCFLDSNLAEEFKRYHSQKAKLRIVRAGCNSRRTTMARISDSTNDLKIE
jgi:hypothetical protein